MYSICLLPFKTMMWCGHEMLTSHTGVPIQYYIQTQLYSCKTCFIYIYRYITTFTIATHSEVAWRSMTASFGGLWTKSRYLTNTVRMCAPQIAASARAVLPLAKIRSRSVCSAKRANWRVFGGTLPLGAILKNAVASAAYSIRISTLGADD